MKLGTRPLCLFAVSLALGCDPRGIRVGTEELCQPESELVVAQATSSEQVSTCARIGVNQLSNGDFEAPIVTCPNGTFCQFPAVEVEGWQTSSADQVIEIWHDGHMGVPASEGSQFAELDAMSRDTLWQDVALPPRQLMYWSFLHRGREGADRVEVSLGPIDATTSQGIFTSMPDAWHSYSGLYRVGDTEVVTRFELVSRTGLTEGNLIDAVVFAPVD